jgi:hypothetical protein
MRRKLFTVKRPLLVRQVTLPPAILFKTQPIEPSQRQPIALRKCYFFREKNHVKNRISARQRTAIVSCHNLKRQVERRAAACAAGVETPCVYSLSERETQAALRQAQSRLPTSRLSALHLRMPIVVHIPRLSPAGATEKSPALRRRGQGSRHSTNSRRDD